MNLLNTPQFSLVECPEAGSYFLLGSEPENGYEGIDELLHIAPVVEHHITGESSMTHSYWTTLNDEISRLKNNLKN